MDRLRALADDLAVGMLFATRIPLPRTAPVEGGDIARASWTLPVIGLLVGLLGALTYGIAFRLRLPSMVGAGLAVASNYRRALGLAKPRGMRPLVAHCHLGLGKLYWRTGKREQAQAHIATATTMYREMGMTYWLEKAEPELARASG